MKNIIIVLFMLATFLLSIWISIEVLGPGTYVDHGIKTKYPKTPFEDGWRRRQGYCHSWEQFYKDYCRKEL